MLKLKKLKIFYNKKLNKGYKIINNKIIKCNKKIFYLCTQNNIFNRKIWSINLAIIKKYPQMKL